MALTVCLFGVIRSAVLSPAWFLALVGLVVAFIYVTVIHLIRHGGDFLWMILLPLVLLTAGFT